MKLGSLSLFLFIQFAISQPPPYQYKCDPGTDSSGYKNLDGTAYKRFALGVRRDLKTE